MLSKVDRIYFLGIGGIGMSSLARYFKMNAYEVTGYDKTPSPLTDTMSQHEDIEINFVDEISSIPSFYTDVEKTLIVYTPAIPSDNKQLNYFKDRGFTIYKRAEVLGFISQRSKAICIAGTHGKTSISTQVAYLLHNSKIGCSAFLGGISMNFNTNVLLNKKSPYVVIEADEFDRSFLHLNPQMALITSMDADHLDIYGTEENIKQAFNEFASKVKAKNDDEEAKIFIKNGLTLSSKRPNITYGLDNNSDCFSYNIRVEDGFYVFDYKGKFTNIVGLKASVPGILNIENLTAAISIALEVGVGEDEIRTSLPNFKGVLRRFNIHVNTQDCVYIDDYAHHPREIEASLLAIKDMWPNNKIKVVFQPHLFSRTNDFYEGFAKSLSIADEVLLLDIYPAREKPMEGVSSKLICDLLTVPGQIIAKDELLDKIKTKENNVVLVTMGAGDIDRFVNKIVEVLI